MRVTPLTRVVRLLKWTSTLKMETNGLTADESPWRMGAETDMALEGELKALGVAWQ